MSNIQIFSNPAFGNVRAVLIDGEPWLVGKDVAAVLGYTNPQKALRDHVDEEDKTMNESFTVNGTQGILINDSGLYSLVLSSKLPSAKAFKRWVTSEVLPSIRRTGGYIAGQEAMTDAELLAQAVLVAQKTIEARDARIQALESKAAIDAPKVAYYEDVLHSEGVLTTTQIAKDYGLSAIELNRILQRQKIQYKVGRQWVLYQEYAGNGYMRSVTVPFERQDGRKDAAVESRWTQEGRRFVHALLTGLGYSVAVPGQIAMQ